MAEQNFKTVDIIDYSMKSSPTQVHDAFDQIITSKVIDGLETRKREVSAKIFTDKVESDPEPETATTEEE